MAAALMYARMKIFLSHSKFSFSPPDEIKIFVFEVKEKGMTDRRSFDRDRRSFFRDLVVIADLDSKKRSQGDRDRKVRGSRSCDRAIFL